MFYDTIDSGCDPTADDNPDRDADGVPICDDCDLGDPTIYPSAPDAGGDDIDSDCHGTDGERSVPVDPTTDRGTRDPQPPAAARPDSVPQAGCACDQAQASTLPWWASLSGWLRRRSG